MKLRKLVGLGVLMIGASYNAVFAQTETKVVVIPLGSDDSVCTTRRSELQTLNTFFNRVDMHCEAGEKLIAGGYRYGSFNTTSNCDVIASFPFDEDTWRVIWGAPTTTECASFSARTYAVCCN